MLNSLRSFNKIECYFYFMLINKKFIDKINIKSI
nr:MAG TPA_asm: hypothetical protein [Caudoviricetes sp.]DAO46937.1 MAG TPA: hypothetical protein [Bacteriophage sp.]